MKTYSIKSYYSRALYDAIIFHQVLNQKLVNLSTAVTEIYLITFSSFLKSSHILASIFSRNTLTATSSSFSLPMNTSAEVPEPSFLSNIRSWVFKSC